MLRTRLHSGPGLFDELRSVWDDLANDSPDATPFQTWGWHSTWWRHYGRFRKPLALAVYEGDDLVGLMPWVRSGGGWRTLRSMGIGPSDYLHPLARAGYQQAVAETVLQAAREMRGIDLVDLHQVRETNWLATVDAEAPVIQATCLVLDLPDSYEGYLASLGKSLRYDVRKLDKTLFTSGRARIESIPPDELGRGLDVLFDLHRARWKEKHLPGAFLGPAMRFHREWAESAAQRKMLWLSLLHVDGEAIGAIYAMSFGKTAYYYQAGFDPSKGAVSPGTLLVAASIRRAIDEGMSHFDFMRGDEPYKRRWKPQRTLRNLRFLHPSSGLRGRVAGRWNMIGSRIEGKLRAKLEGHGL